MNVFSKDPLLLQVGVTGYLVVGAYVNFGRKDFLVAALFGRIAMYGIYALEEASRPIRERAVQIVQEQSQQIWRCFSRAS